tara:strand:- start:20 stop:535 length:516 start_codon:yes stop_codon:yes gene_type:complete
MYSAQDVLRPQFDGFHFSEQLKIGTGGHGDTTKAYTETFSTKVSLITNVIKYNTGKKDAKGKSIYYIHKYKTLRAGTLLDCNVISPLIANEFKKVGFGMSDKVNCFDLMRWTKNKKDEDVEVKRGLSFVIGSYEARLIKGRHVFLYNTDIVRTLVGAGKRNEKRIKSELTG